MHGFHTNLTGPNRSRPAMGIALLVCLWQLDSVPRAYGQPAAYLRNLEQEVVRLVERVETTVVSVIVQRKFIHSVNGQTYTDWERSVGTGVVLHRDGYILTTAGVVDHAHDILVNFKDGRYRLGELVGVDAQSNIAVVRVDSASVHSARLGDSDDASPGTWVLVMNNDHGFPSSMTTGIVNGVREEDVLLQVSAVAAGDFSGGAVFSTNGRLMGLVAEPNRDRSSASGLRGGEGAGVIAVIPINRIRTFARQLIEYGEIRRSWLGVFVEKIWDSISVGDDRNIMLGTGEGMEVTDVYPDSPAMKVGLRKGDILLAVNGVPMNHPIILAEFVTSLPVGTRIEIKYLRGHAENTVHTVLAPQPKPKPPDSPDPSRFVEDGSETMRAREDPRLIRQLIMEHEKELAAHRLKLNQLKRLLEERVRQMVPRAAGLPGDDGF